MCDLGFKPGCICHWPVTHAKPPPPQILVPHTSFLYKTQADSERPSYGLIAEEVSAVDPNLVYWTPDKDDARGEREESVHYQMLAPLLVKEAQLLRARVEALEALNKALEARVAALEAAAPKAP